MVVEPVVVVMVDPSVVITAVSGLVVRGVVMARSPPLVEALEPVAVPEVAVPVAVPAVAEKDERAPESREH